jgi:hypothetical protein
MISQHNGRGNVEKADLMHRAQEALFIEDRSQISQAACRSLVMTRSFV